MALWQILGAVRRHLVVVVIGALLTAGGLYLVQSHQGVYVTRTDVVLVPPEGTYIRNPLWRRENSVIATASLVAAIVNSDSGGARTSSSSVSLAGQGVDDGYSAQLYNRGGQWVVDYDRPLFNVQAVGRTPEAATANLERGLDELQSALDLLQDRMDVVESQRMTLDTVTPEPEVGYGVGRPTRALAATAVLGVGLTLAAVTVVDDRRWRAGWARLLRRRTRPSAGVTIGGGAGTRQPATVRIPAATRSPLEEGEAGGIEDRPTALPVR